MTRTAIVGLACLFPGASNLESFWSNIVDGVDAISEVPPGRWDASFYDAASSAVDRFYCKRGGFVDRDASFDPLEFGIAPNTVDSIEPDQLLTLKVGFEALRDAGLDKKPFPRGRTGVIIGRGNYISAGVLRLEQHVRLLPQILQTLQDLFPDLPPAALEATRVKLRKQLTHYGPDVAAGLIPNLIASRLANRLDLHGPAFTVDAACASAVVALEQACAALARGETDLMLVGGAHLTHDLTFWATFCQLGALSRRGVSSPLSAEADGILAGEGIGMAVVKRLDDALAAGDRIYAVIEGIGTSSDGRASSLVAPASSGQMIALEKAWSSLDFGRDALGLVETHGTATPTGDQVEMETLARFFGEHGGDGAKSVAGSVKSMIGHAMPASGMASLIKTALSIYHGVLPPTLHCEKPHPQMAKTRFRVIGRSEAWAQAREQRVAALNAFGFGGVNGHVVLRGLPETASPFAPARKSTGLQPALLLSAETPEALLARLDRGERDTVPGKAPCRLAIIEPNERKLAMARKAIASGKPWQGRQQIWYSPRGLIGSGGKLAFLFPGVDSSFAPNAAGVADYFGLTLPPHCRPLDPAKELSLVVRGVLTFNLLMLDVMSRLGIRADAIAGHSIGEWTASAASGMVDRAEGEAGFGGIDWESVRFPDRPYVAASCDVERLRQIVAGIEPLVISHDNCPHQVIACGSRAAVEEAFGRLQAARIFCQILPMVSGFHSPWFEPSSGPFRDMVAKLQLKDPAVPLWSVASATLFPAGEKARRERMFRQLLEPVQFRALTQALHDDGVRVFVQIGTGSLANFIDDSLGDKPHHAIESHSEKRGGMEQLQHLSAALWVEGAAFDTIFLTGEPTSEPAAKRESAGRQLSLGVPLLRVDEPLDRSLLPVSMRASALAEMPPVAANDAVGRLLQDTLADIERAGREVLEVWQQHRGGVRPRQASGSPRFNATVQKLLDIEKTIPWVDDHSFHPEREGWPILADRRPVVPMTMEVLLVREALENALAERGFGHLKVIEAAKVQAFNWLDVAEPVTVDITIRSAGEFAFDVDIVGYFSARLIVSAQYPAADLAPSAPLANPRPTMVSAAQLYSEYWMFHGPAYQGVSRFDGIGDNGIDGELQVPTGVGSLLDNMGQLAGYWVMEQPESCLAMPIGVDRIRFFGPDPLPGESLKARVRVSLLDDQSCVSDHTLRDSSGQLRIAIDGWKTRRFQMDQDHFRRNRAIDRSEFSQIVPPNVAVFEDRHSSVLVRDHFSWRYLTAVEREAYAKLPPRRRRQWLNGRIAAKDAVRSYLRRKHGLASVFPKELRIENGPAGAPYIRANVTDTVPETLYISLSHKDRMAAAIVGERPVGIDVERIEPRTQGFIDITFSPQEQAVLAGEDVDVACTRGWVAKEAVAKANGTGLQGRLGDFLIDARDGDCFRVNGHWVVTHRLDDYIVGWLLDVSDAAATLGLDASPDFPDTSRQALIA